MDVFSSSGSSGGMPSILRRTLRSLIIAVFAGGVNPAWCAWDVVSKTPAEKPSAQETMEIVNINTADATELTGLDGIGDTKAAAIVEYRRRHGPFTSVEQLTEVKGIGERTIAKNRARIRVR